MAGRLYAVSNICLEMLSSLFYPGFKKSRWFSGVVIGECIRYFQHLYRKLLQRAQKHLSHGLCLPTSLRHRDYHTEHELGTTVMSTTWGWRELWSLEKLELRHEEEAAGAGFWKGEWVEGQCAPGKGHLSLFPISHIRSRKCIWSTDQQHRHHLETCRKVKSQAPPQTH